MQLASVCARLAAGAAIVLLSHGLAAQPVRPPLGLTDRAAARWVEQTLKKMTLDEKIGQLLVTSLNATFTSRDGEVFERLRHLVRDVKVGGVHVFGGEERMPALMLNANYGSGAASRKGDPFSRNDCFCGRYSWRRWSSDTGICGGGVGGDLLIFVENVEKASRSPARVALLAFLAGRHYCVDLVKPAVQSHVSACSKYDGCT